MTDTERNTLERSIRAADFLAYLASFQTHIRNARELPLYGIDNRVEDVVSRTLGTLAARAHSMTHSVLPDGPDAWVAGQVNVWMGELTVLVDVCSVYMDRGSELRRVLAFAAQNLDSLQTLAGLAVVEKMGYLAKLERWKNELTPAERKALDSEGLGR